MTDEQFRIILDALWGIQAAVREEEHSDFAVFLREIGADKYVDQFTK